MNTNIPALLNRFLYVLSSNVLLIYLIKLLTDSLFLCPLWFSKLNEVISCYNPTRTTITLYICLRTCANNRFILNYRQKLSLQNHGFTKQTGNTKRNYVKFKQLAEL